MDMYGGRKGVSEAWGERERGRKEGSNEGRRGGREGKGGTGREEGAQDIRQLHLVRRIRDLFQGHARPNIAGVRLALGIDVPVEVGLDTHIQQ